MNPTVGWALVVALGAAAWNAYGPVEGLVVAATATAFWLLLQYTRAMRAMTAAGRRPVGHVPSAVMLNARLAAGMTMLDIIKQTRSLGRKTDAAGERWSWHDEGGASVDLVFERGKLVRWTLRRDPPDDAGVNA